MDPNSKINLDSPSKIKKRRRAESAATVASTVAGILTLGKLLLYVSSGSLIIALSALDSFADTMISLIHRKVISFSRSQADKEHPYGHGKIESIAALGQGALIVGGGIVVLVSSVIRVVSAKHTEQDEFFKNIWWGAGFFLLAAIVSGGVSYWLRQNGRALGSPALLADSKHYDVDVWANLGSGLALLAMAKFQTEWCDPLGAAGLAVYMCFGGFQLLRQSVDELMDKDIPDDVKFEAARVVFQAAPEVQNIHKFRSRRSGQMLFFDFHVTLPARLGFEEVHVILDSVERALLTRFSPADVIVHADPDTLVEPIEERALMYERQQD